ncbi:MAG: amidohydrolase family protein [Spirochaetota bacterium]|jgi:N-acyl-D-aspartate/D-glutamate deacylase|nr:amidohydrolase family protein [Spirochaetota bacterium]
MRGDILVQGGIVLDGTGAPARRADILIAGDTIISLVPPRKRACAPVIIDARGRYVMPGIIDSHTHSDLALLEDEGLRPKIMQGVTTEVPGQCGLSVFPLPPERREGWRKRSVIGGAGYTWGWADAASWLADLGARGLETNVVPFVGAGTVRYGLAGDADQDIDSGPDSPFMRALEESFAAGIAGLSFGLIYIPAIFSRREELLAAAKCAARHDRPLAVHLRSESNALAAAVREIHALAEESGARLTISHLKVIGRANRRQLDDVLEFIDAHDIAFDAYPYGYGSTTLFSIIPPWLVSEGGAEAVLDRLNRRDVREYLAALWTMPSGNARVTDLRNLRSRRKSAENQENIGRPIPDHSPKYSQTFHGARSAFDNLPFELGWENIRIVYARNAEQEICGKTIAEIARARGTDPANAAMDILAASRGDVRIIDDFMDEEAVIAILRNRHGVIASDALFGASPAAAHPRLHSCFPYAMRRYALEQKILSPEEAVYKMTGLPAARLGLGDRGRLALGYKADIAVFDADFGTAACAAADHAGAANGLYALLVNGRIKVNEYQYDPGVRAQLVQGRTVADRMSAHSARSWMLRVLRSASRIPEVCTPASGTAKCPVGNGASVRAGRLLLQ